MNADTTLRRFFLILLLFLLIIIPLHIKAQETAITTIRGTVSDENGELLVGVNVVYTNDRSKGTTTDLYGNYTLKVPGTGEFSLTVSYISYQTQTIKLTLNPGEVVIKNILMRSEAIQISEAVISAKALRSADTYMQRVKTRSATTLDYISAATIRKTGDANVTAAISRITGVSTHGSFITVRGIGDRYISTAINGSVIPTLDPFTNNIKLDIFPASLVDNIIVTKTHSADLPGDWAGAYISVETRDFPEELSVNISTSIGYRPSTTFKEINSTQRSATDWLGFDNGFRDYDHSTYVVPSSPPSDYQTFVALGLGEFLGDLGVTNETPWKDSYFRLCLVELGLLGPAQVNDPQAYQEARSNFLYGTLPSDAFRILNKEAAEAAQRFPSNFQLVKRKAPLNFSQSFTVGNQVTFLGMPLGFIAGFRYGSNVEYDQYSEMNRTDEDIDGNITYDRKIRQTFTNEVNGWNALLSVSLKATKNHSLSLLYMPNFKGTNKVRDASDLLAVDASGRGNTIKSQVYEERQQQLFQVASEHYFPRYKVRMNVQASYTSGKSNIPDFKDVEYFRDEKGNGTLVTTHRYYRYLEDELLDSKLSLEIPLNARPGLARKLKAGIAYLDLQRSFRQYDYFMQFGEGGARPFSNDDLDGFFDPEYFGLFTTINSSGLIQSSLRMMYLQNDRPSNHQVGNKRIRSAYIMLDYTLLPKLRFAGGIRAEDFNLYTDAYLYDTEGIPQNDERRINFAESFTVQPGSIQKLNILPSSGLIYKLKDTETLISNLRASYAISVARPSIREQYDGGNFDFELRREVLGNSTLDITTIHNIDLRYETSFLNGDNFFISLFYKQFSNHIEMVESPLAFGWLNVEKSYVRGIELEGRKALTRGLELRANISLVNSRTDFVQTTLVKSLTGAKEYVPLAKISRTMYGQAPYVINAMLNYTLDSLGLEASLSYNIQGPRLVISSPVGPPDVYELPRHLLDCKVSKRLGKRFSLSILVKDILATSRQRAYDYPDGLTIYYDTYTYGTAYQLNLSYKI